MDFGYFHCFFRSTQANISAILNHRMAPKAAKVA